MTCSRAFLARALVLSVVMTSLAVSTAMAQAPPSASPAGAPTPSALGAPAFPSRVTPLSGTGRAVAVKTASHAQRNGAIKGALIGFGIGAGGGLLLQYGACENECFLSDDAGPGILLLAGIGSGIGAAIGAYVNRGNGQAPATSAKPGKAVAFAPILSRTRKGAAVTITWR